jgi:hypothetical protein
MSCKTCDGKGYIIRPVEFIQHEVKEEVWCEWLLGFKLVSKFVTSEIGGLDACPDCTKASEAEYG